MERVDADGHSNNPILELELREVARILIAEASPWTSNCASPEMTETDVWQSIASETSWMLPGAS